LKQALAASISQNIKRGIIEARKRRMAQKDR
jgi:hypothetical protein